MSDVRDVEGAVKSCYATWSRTYYDDYLGANASYPPVHVGIVRDLLKGCRSVVDAGCGPASMLRDLDLPHLDRYGFDLTPEMVDEARRILSGQGVPAEHVWQGSVLDNEAFRRQPDWPQGYDAAICFGVLPHVPQHTDATVLEHLVGAVRPGGLVAVEARNQLFALFTLNRYSFDFFAEQLIGAAGLRDRAGNNVDHALEELAQRFRLDLPHIRRGKEGEPGYDEVLSRTHNPFLLREVAARAGLVDAETLFYHYHRLPPMLERHMPDLFRAASIEMEDPHDWRGYFMASAFILVGRRNSGDDPQERLEAL